MNANKGEGPGALRGGAEPEPSHIPMAGDGLGAKREGLQAPVMVPPPWTGSQDFGPYSRTVWMPKQSMNRAYLLPTSA